MLSFGPGSPALASHDGDTSRFPFFRLSRLFPWWFHVIVRFCFCIAKWGFLEGIVSGPQSCTFISALAQCVNLTLVVRNPLSESFREIQSHGYIWVRIIMLMLIVILLQVITVGFSTLYNKIIMVHQTCCETNRWNLYRSSTTIDGRRTGPFKVLQKTQTVRLQAGGGFI